MTKKLTLAGFCEAVSLKRRGAQIVSITARTVPAMRKTNNPYFGKVTKLTKLNGMVNWIYENAVNNQRKRENLEPDFVAEKRQWGDRVEKFPFVVHTTKDGQARMYLEVKAQKCLSVEYFDLDGNRIDEALLKPFLSEKKDSRQGVENEVILRDFMVTNIEEISMDGEHFQIDGRTEEEMARLTKLLIASTASTS